MDDFAAESFGGSGCDGRGAVGASRRRRGQKSDWAFGLRLDEDRGAEDRSRRDAVILPLTHGDAGGVGTACHDAESRQGIASAAQASERGNDHRARGNGRVPSRRRMEAGGSRVGDFQRVQCVARNSQCRRDARYVSRDQLEDGADAEGVEGYFPALRRSFGVESQSSSPLGGEMRLSSRAAMPAFFSEVT